MLNHNVGIECTPSVIEKSTSARSTPYGSPNREKGNKAAAINKSSKAFSASQMEPTNEGNSSNHCTSEYMDLLAVVPAILGFCSPGTLDPTGSLIDLLSRNELYPKRLSGQTLSIHCDIPYGVHS